MFGTFALLSYTFCQNDSQEVKRLRDTADYRLKSVTHYLDINLTDETKLFKLSPSFAVSKHRFSPTIYLGYEIKIGKQFSILTCIDNNIVISNRFTSYDKSWHYYLNSTLSFDVRYYPFIRQKIYHNVSGNNLIGFYSGIGLNILEVYKSNYKYSKHLNTHLSDILSLKNPSFSIGYQNRLSKWAYVDVFGTFIIWESGQIGYFYTGFRVGFAWKNK